MRHGKQGITPVRCARNHRSAGGAVTAVGSGTICPPVVPACEDFSGIWEGITESWGVDGANPYLQLNWSHVLNVTRLEGQTG